MLRMHMHMRARHIAIPIKGVAGAGAAQRVKRKITVESQKKGTKKPEGQSHRAAAF
jgi:hypothetical protein